MDIVIYVFSLIPIKSPKLFSVSDSPEIADNSDTHNSDRSDIISATEVYSSSFFCFLSYHSFLFLGKLSLWLSMGKGIAVACVSISLRS